MILIISQQYHSESAQNRHSNQDVTGIDQVKKVNGNKVENVEVRRRRKSEKKNWDFKLFQMSFFFFWFRFFFFFSILKVRETYCYYCNFILLYFSVCKRLDIKKKKTSYLAAQKRILMYCRKREKTTLTKFISYFWAVT